MARKRKAQAAKIAEMDLSPLVAASLSGIIYQAKLLNRQSRLNIPEQEVISEVMDLWQTGIDVLSRRGSSRIAGESMMARFLSTMALRRDPSPPCANL